MPIDNSVSTQLDTIGAKIGRDIVYTTVSEFCKFLQEHSSLDNALLKELSSDFLSYQAQNGIKIKSAVVTTRTKKTPAKIEPRNNVTTQLLNAIKGSYDSYTWHDHPEDSSYKYTDSFLFRTGRYPLAQNRVVVGASTEDGEMFEMLPEETEEARQRNLL